LLLASIAVAQTAPQGPPPAVTTAVVQSREIAPAAEYIGRVDAILSFDARARVEGFLQQVAFREGQHARAGDLLFVIEPGPYQAALTSARAQLARATAQKDVAQRNFERIRELHARGTTPQAALDEATAARDAAAADVLAAQAAVQTAELNLGYTRIHSAIDGRVGATAVTQGNLVGPNSGVLANVVQLDPIRVVFSVSDRDLLYAQRRWGVQLAEELVRRFVPTLHLPDESDYPEPGRIEFIDNRFDPTTGTVAVRAIFPNPQELLLPGQLVTVRVRAETAERRPVVPMSAVQQDREGRYVLVLDADNRVQQRRIETGAQIEQRWVVEKGLREGETIVVEGQQKVRPGMLVQPTPQAESASG
jgi:membrane fusion protein (multidrug efflux system)